MSGPDRPNPSIARVGLRNLLYFGIFVAAWKLAVVWMRIPPFFMPPPEAVAEALVKNGGTIGYALFATLRNAFVGLAAAFAMAIALAALFTSSRSAARAVLPLVIGLRTAPVLAIAPILIMIFGRGLGTSVAVVVIVSFFPIMVNAMKGFSATPANALELMHMLGANALTTFARVRLPFALPYIFSGLRSAATGAVLAAMLAEWLSGAPGLGSTILDASSFRRSALMWAAVVVSMLAAFTLFFVTERVERRFLSWRYRAGSS